MWCVAELDEEYLGRMEDVLALYEKPLSETEPVVCIDEKPVVLHADLRRPQAHASGRNSSARLRVRTPWHGQRVLRSGAEGRTALSPRDSQPFLAPSLPIICWRLRNTIQPPTPSIWSWTI